MVLQVIYLILKVFLLFTLEVILKENIGLYDLLDLIIE